MKPFVNALLLADYVHVDRMSGKCTIVGTFDQVIVKEFPGIHGGAYIYVNLSDFKGTHEFSFRFLRDSDGQQIAQSAPIPIQQPDKLKHHEIALNLPPLTFTHAGTYALEILWDGEWLGAVKGRARKGK